MKLPHFRCQSQIVSPQVTHNFWLGYKQRFLWPPPTWIWLFARTAHRTLGNKVMFTSLLHNNNLKDSDEQPDGEKHWARSRRDPRATGKVSCLTLHLGGCSPLWKLSESHTIGISMEAFPHGCDQLLTPFLVLLLSLEDEGWVWKSKLLIIAWSVWGPVSIQESFRTPPH